MFSMIIAIGISASILRAKAKLTLQEAILILRILTRYQTSRQHQTMSIQILVLFIAQSSLLRTEKLFEIGWMVKAMKHSTNLEWNNGKNLWSNTAIQLIKRYHIMNNNLVLKIIDCCKKREAIWHKIDQWKTTIDTMIRCANICESLLKKMAKIFYWRI